MTEVNEPVATALVSSKDPQPGKLKVRVVSNCDGAGIKGAEVIVNAGGKKIKKTTDGSGLADIGEVPARSHVAKVMMHFTDADYFLILVHYPRITWAKKAIVEALGSISVPEGGEAELQVPIKVFRLVTPIIFKRQQIQIRPLEYGHWWTELGGGESYGWWPSRGVSPLDTVMGVPGVLNGVGYFTGGTATRDPHDGDRADQKFSPVIDDCRTDDDLKDRVRGVARGYSGKWSWIFEFGNHCHTFQKKVINAVNARGFKDV